jgi:hypothetical protein
VLEEEVIEIRKWIPDSLEVRLHKVTDQVIKTDIKIETFRYELKELQEKMKAQK